MSGPNLAETKQYEFFIENSDLIPDIQKLRRYIKKENFKEIISSLPFKQNLMKIENILKFAFSPIKMFLDPRAVEQLKLIFKFMDIIESQRWIKKRDLYRKLRIKKRCLRSTIKKSRRGRFRQDQRIYG